MENVLISKLAHQKSSIVYWVGAVLLNIGAVLWVTSITSENTAVLILIVGIFFLYQRRFLRILNSGRAYKSALSPRLIQQPKPGSAGYKVHGGNVKDFVRSVIILVVVIAAIGGIIAIHTDSLGAGSRDGEIILLWGIFLLALVLLLIVYWRLGKNRIR